MLNYQPLKDGEFRLLQIHPLSRSQTDLATLSLCNVPIQCTLITVARRKAPVYRALSYTWGDSKDLVPITVNSETQLVTRNLLDALEHIRDENDIITIWNDATCINQADDLEKCEQVQQMASIYASSQGAIVWLGPAADGSDEFIQWCKGTAKKLSELNFIDGKGDNITFLGLLDEVGAVRPSKTSEKQGYSHLGQPVLEVLKGLFEEDGKDPEKTVEFIKASRSLMDRGYWNRVWVRQEFVVSPEIRIQCGNSTFQFEELRAILCYLQLMAIPLLTSLKVRRDNIWANSTEGPKFKMAKWVLAGYPEADLDEEHEEPVVKKYKNLWRCNFKLPTLLPKESLSIFALRSSYHSYGKENKQQAFTLWRMLVKAHVENIVGVTNDRDRIFALLSIATDKDQLGIKTTYNKEKSNREIFCQAAQDMIAAGHVDLISFSQHRPENESLDIEKRTPSWVPDWRKPIVRPCGQLPWESSFNASGERRFHYGSDSSATQQDPEVLILSGWIIDSIEEALTPWIPISDGKFVMVDKHPTLSRFLEDVKNLCKLSDAKFHFTSNEIYVTNPTKERKSAYILVPIADQESYSVTTIGRATEESEKIYTLLQKEIGQKVLSAESIAYVGMMNAQKFRRPFLSTQGYVGLAPDLAEAGDVIAIFAGAKFSYVLRENEDGSFRLIGDAYVHGIMYGEFLSKDREEKTFILR